MMPWSIQQESCSFFAASSWQVCSISKCHRGEWPSRACLAQVCGAYLQYVGGRSVKMEAAGLDVQILMKYKCDTANSKTLSL